MEDTPRRSIGIYGGTFDPVHLGHLQMARNAMETLSLDEVIFIPAYTPPHKMNRGENASERLDMLRIAISDEPRFDIDEIEMKARETRYTVSTVTTLIQENPDAHFYFILGEDSLRDIHSWHQWQELFALIDLIVCPRPDIPGDLEALVQDLNAEGARIQIADGPTMGISSTNIRQRRQKGLDVRYLVPHGVFQYISEHSLYCEDPSPIDAEFMKEVQEESLDFLDHLPWTDHVQRLRKMLKRKRFEHVIRVVQTASFLARRFGVDVNAARLAALLHDCAKGNERFYFEKLRKQGVLEDKDWKLSPIYHAHLGTYVARCVYGVKDPTVLRAIYGHTTGHLSMSPVDKIVFVADEIEPGRNYEGVMELRKLAMEDLDKAVLRSMDTSIEYLLEQGVPIEPETIVNRNDLLSQKKDKGKD